MPRHIVFSLFYFFLSSSLPHTEMTSSALVAPFFKGTHTHQLLIHCHTCATYGVISAAKTLNASQRWICSQTKVGQRAMGTRPPRHICLPAVSSTIMTFSGDAKRNVLRVCLKLSGLLVFVSLVYTYTRSEWAAEFAKESEIICKLIYICIHIYYNDMMNFIYLMNVCEVAELYCMLQLH